MKTVSLFLQAITFYMKNGGKGNVGFIFAMLPDRDFVVETLSDLLSKLKVFKGLFYTGAC